MVNSLNRLSFIIGENRKTTTEGIVDSTKIVNDNLLNLSAKVDSMDSEIGILTNAVDLIAAKAQK